MAAFGLSLNVLRKTRTYLSALQGQHHDWWGHGNAGRQGISSNGIDFTQNNDSVAIALIISPHLRPEKIDFDIKHLFFFFKTYWTLRKFKCSTISPRGQWVKNLPFSSSRCMNVDREGKKSSSGLSGWAPNEHMSPANIIFPHAVRCRYNMISFPQNHHKRHPIARLLGRDMGRLLWVQNLI